MSAVRALLTRMRSLFQSDAAVRLNEELQEHAELLAADYVARGMPPAEAHYAALRELGNLTSLRQEFREQSGLPWLENFVLDLKFALRTLRRNPSFTAACVTTLTVGLGSLITVLCVVAAFFWNPLPFPKPDSLVVLKEVDPRNGAWTFSEPAFLDIQQRSTSLSMVAAYHRQTLALTGAGEPEAILGAAVTPSLFPLLGIKESAGSALSQSETSVFISKRLWQRKWHTSALAVGSTVVLDGATYTVAGIGDVPGELLPGVELLFPLIPKAGESRTAHEIDVIGRLRNGISIGQAQAELSTIGGRIAREHEQTNAGWTFRAIPLSRYLLPPDVSHGVWMIFGAVVLLWLLACLNVAGLQIARGVSRRHEISTRLALGASRTRLLSQTFTESLVLSLAGGLLGTIAAEYALAAVRELGSRMLPRLAYVHLDVSLLLIPVGCLLISTVLFGLLSARPGAFEARREVAARDRGRDALIVMQVALASVLLLGASLLFESFIRLRAVNPGFNPENLMSARVNLADMSHDNLQRVAFFERATGELSRLPGVQSVGATNVLPFSGEGTANRFRIAGDSLSDFRSAAWRAVTPGFFSMLKLPLRYGRFFTEGDRNGSLEVVILSESMARGLWPAQDPVGKQLLWGKSGSPKTVVGVVGDLRDLAVGEPPVATMFRPFAQLSDAPMTLLIRTQGDPMTAMTGIRQRVAALDPNAALEYQSIGEAMSASILRPRAGFTAVAVFALLALTTAAFGLYGLISYRVNQRRQEIGIRLALGAEAGRIRWDVQKRCLSLVCWGAMLGLPVAFALSSFTAAVLYNTEPTRPGAYCVVFFIFIAVAFVASFGPAIRAARIDPAAAIRYE